jgi:hypothetical protein
VDASYDPAFYPDNSGFIFHGTPIDGSGGAYCALSLLDDEPDEIGFEGDEECSQIANIATYQHLGKGIDEGGDYFIINSPFTSDNGGHSATHNDPSASYGDSSEIRITPMVNVGGRYEAGQVATFSTPKEGDSVLSPSTQLVAGHIGDDNGRPLGYVIRKLSATRTADGYEIDAPEVARICANGTKPAFSYDERFLVFHHYVEESDWAELGFASPTDAEWLTYLDKGASNLFIVDLTTGEKRRITNMPAGQFALFPHFRSDGWIYFLVREPGSNAERVGASDAAVVLGN